MESAPSDDIDQPNGCPETSPDSTPNRRSDDRIPELPGVPLTTRNRIKSALLWGLVGGLAFLVLAQGYLLLGGTLPFRYALLFVVAIVVAVVASGLVYRTEHWIRSKRRT